jgi:polysaccharide export outer membrane protein
MSFVFFKVRHFVRLVVCAAVLTGAALAQESPAAGMAAARGDAVADAAEVVAAGDQVVINIADLDEVHNLSARIASDGNLDLPLVGLVRADGMTIAQLRAMLVDRYSKYVHSPQVSVQVTSSQSRTVSVIGEVNSPSVQEITGSLTLVSAITKSGGIRPDAGAKVIVTRDPKSGKLPMAEAISTPDGHTRVTLSLDDLLAAKTPENNITLRAGDVVSIPKGNLVYVIGNVHKSGGFPLRSSGTISLIEALALAEGLAPNARSQDAKILRPVANSEKRQEIPVNISQVLSGKRADPMLFSDDILFVPNSAAKSGARRTAEAILQVTTGVLIYR